MLSIGNMTYVIEHENVVGALLIIFFIALLITPPPHDEDIVSEGSGSLYGVTAIWALPLWAN